MNQDRMQLLSQYEAAAGQKALTCEKILAAMFIPAMKLARDHEQGGKNFLRLLGRAYADPAPFIREFLSNQYGEMIARFRTAFSNSLPHIPREELSWPTTSCCYAVWRLFWPPDCAHQSRQKTTGI